MRLYRMQTTTDWYLKINDRRRRVVAKPTLFAIKTIGIKG